MSDILKNFAIIFNFKLSGHFSLLISNISIYAKCNQLLKISFYVYDMHLKLLHLTSFTLLTCTVTPKYRHRHAQTQALCLDFTQI